MSIFLAVRLADELSNSLRALSYTMFPALVFGGEVTTMRNSRTPMLIVAAGLLIAAAANPLFAHHANAVFDITKTVTVKGTVTDWFWANPHCLLRFDVTDENGQVSHWVGETQAPINMIGKGWRRDSFKPGDELTVSLRPLKNGKPGGSVLNVTLANGKVLETASENIYKPGASPNQDAPEPAPQAAPQSNDAPKQ